MTLSYDMSRAVEVETPEMTVGDLRETIYEMTNDGIDINELVVRVALLGSSVTFPIGALSLEIVTEESGETEQRFVLEIA